MTQNYRWHNNVNGRPYSAQTVMVIADTASILDSAMHCFEIDVTTPQSMLTAMLSPDICHIIGLSE